LRSKKYKILFAHTTGYWWDHRYYFKQMPILNKDFADVSYLIKKDSTIKNIPFTLIQISENEAKYVRLTGGLNLFFKFFKIDVDAIQMCNIELIPVGILLAIFSRKKIFYDCREDHFHAMLHSKVWFPKWFRYILGYGVKTIEFLASKTFSGFIDSDPSIYRFHNMVPKSNKMIFYNMALKNQFKPGESSKQRIFDFVVLGSMSVRTGVLDVVKALGRLKEEGEKINLKLIGDPELDKVLWKQIEEIIKKHQLQDDIIITGRIPYFDIPNALSDCRIGVIPLLDLPKFRNNIATKQFEYMASGIPIIASKLDPQRYFIRKGHNGCHYEPGNVDELSDRMRELLHDKNKVKQYSQNCINDVLNHKINSEEQQLKYLKFYQLRMENKSYVENQIPVLNG